MLDSDTAAARPPVPHDVLVRICRHLAAQIPPLPPLQAATPSPPSSSPQQSADEHAPSTGSSARAALAAILRTGWHGYHAALPFLYARVEGGDLPAVCAGIAPGPDLSSAETSLWPNDASCVRKLEALRCVRSVSVGAWPILEPSPGLVAHPDSDEDDEDDESPDVYGGRMSESEYACYDALLALQKGTRLFPHLQAIVFHSAAMQWIETDALSAAQAFRRIEDSPLYHLLAGEKAAHVCIHLPDAAAQPESFVAKSFYIGFAQHLLNTWAESPSPQPLPTLTLHNVALTRPPVFEVMRGLRASRIRLWPGTPGVAETYDRPWAANLDIWYELIYWVWELFDMRNYPRHVRAQAGADQPRWPREWEFAVRPVIPMTCGHKDDYAVSAFWLRVLLRKDVMGISARRALDGDETPFIDLDMPHWAAMEPCGACGAHVKAGERWWSQPLAEALATRGAADMEIGEQMRALHRRARDKNCSRVQKGSRVKKGSCNAHGWDVAHMAKAVERDYPPEFEFVREQVVRDMLRDAVVILRRRGRG